MSVNPYSAIQDFVAGLPELVQPLMVGVVSMIPYVEGEGAVAAGILVGVNPIVAFIAAVLGNTLAVAAVVLLSSRVRGAVVSRRASAKQARATAATPSGLGGASAADAGVRVPTATVTRTDTSTETEADTDADTDAASTDQSRRAKGRSKIAKWVVRFGVPGASLLGPIALPTHLTAAFLVASGVSRGWVMLWQVVAIVLWTSLVAVAAFGAATALGFI